MSIDPDVDTFVSNDVAHIAILHIPRVNVIWTVASKPSKTRAISIRKIRKMLPLEQLFNDRVLVQKCKGPVWPKGPVRFVTTVASCQRTTDMWFEISRQCHVARIKWTRLKVSDKERFFG